MHWSNFLSGAPRRSLQQPEKRLEIHFVEVQTIVCPYPVINTVKLIHWPQCPESDVLSIHEGIPLVIYS